MKRHSKRAIIYMLVAAAFFATMGACLKYALEIIPVYQTIFFRSIVSTLVIGSVVYFRRLPSLGKNRKFLLARSLCGFVAMSCGFYALSKIPLADAAVLHHTSPLFVALLSVIFLGEKMTVQVVVLLFLAALSCEFSGLKHEI